MPEGVRNWEALLAWGRVRLEQAGIDEAPDKIRWVAAHLLGCGLLAVGTVTGAAATATFAVACAAPSVFVARNTKANVPVALGVNDSVVPAKP